MSLNGYSWVEGNVINAIDPSGMEACTSTLDVICPDGGGGSGGGGSFALVPLLERIATGVGQALRQVCVVFNGALCQGAFELLREGIFEGIQRAAEEFNSDNLKRCIDECKYTLTEGFGPCIDDCRRMGKPYLQCQSECMKELSQYLLRCEARCREIFE